MKYRVELEELLAFVGRLEAFETRAEAIAARVDKQVADLRMTWSGVASEAHGALHDEWMAGATQMRESAADLRAAAARAHSNYTDAVKTNIEMLTS